MAIIHFLITTLTLNLFTPATVTRAQLLPGTWETLVADAGVASMHTAVTRHNTVVLLDRTDIGPTRKLLPRGHCRRDPRDAVLKLDCYAHSALLDLSTNDLRPLTILTDTWCSSGQFLPDGSLLQTGGDSDGLRKIRRFSPCEDRSCDWTELADAELAEGRWYATNQILPDGAVIIVGGRGANTVEFFPARKSSVTALPFLLAAEDKQMDNLYPYVHLLPNGHLFIFANDKAIMYDYDTGEVLVNYPPLTGGPRNYPSAGSSAMLALAGDFSEAVVVVCGGARFGAYIRKWHSSPAHGSCGRIVATRPDPVWETEEMPFGRVMGDMVMLPEGNVLIINGAQRGSQGFESASDPCLYPLLYRPDQPLGLRFMTLNPGTVPRMYHSTANLLPDGRVMVAGSNPHVYYKFTAEFPTELRIEAFSPEYLSPDRSNLRPAIDQIPTTTRYNEAFEVVVSVPLPVVGVLEVNLASAPFATHSFSQGQRLVKLAVRPSQPVGEGKYRIYCTAPPSGKVAPPGYYMAFVVNQGTKFWRRPDLSEEEQTAIKALFAVPEEERHATKLLLTEDLEKNGLFNSINFAFYFQHNRPNLSPKELTAMKRRWEEMVVLSDDELEKRREDLRSQVASPVKTTPTPSNIETEKNTPVAGEKNDDDDSEDHLPLKRPRRAMAKKKRGKSIPETSQGVTENLTVSDEIKDQLPYPVREAVNAIGDHYTIEQWSSITSGSIAERIKLVHAKQVDASMGSTALYSDLNTSLAALEKRVADGEKRATKDKGEIERLKRDLKSADKISQEAQLKHIKLEKIFESEKKRFQEELEVEKNAVAAAAQKTISLEEENATLKANREKDITLAHLEATDMTGPIMQPILKKARYRFYKEAVEDMKSQFPDHDYSFVDNEVAELFKTLKNETPQKENVQGAQDASGSGQDKV